jgi:DsbE subfamily thiol:disulfide oxidoreductase
MSNKIYLLPLAIFLVLTGFFVYRLMLIGQGHMPNDIPSVMINQPAPQFNLPPLLKKTAGFKTDGLKGKVTLVSFFASWCVECLAEHPYLATLSGKGAVLAGIDYKDNDAAGQAWLKKNGNPYDIVAVDRSGRTAIDFGLYGVPESYLIDKRGVIRYKQTGPLTPAEIEGRLLPLIKELNK